LFAPREDGRTRSNQGNSTRKSSLALEAQIHPMTTLALGLAGAAAAFALGGKRR
jgi:hypothetical protein